MPLEIDRRLGPPTESDLTARRGFVADVGRGAATEDPVWLRILAEGLGHFPYCLEARRDGRLVGLLPLALVRSLLFGRYLVSLPFLNSGGVMTEPNDAEAAAALVRSAVELAGTLRVRHLELRHETPLLDERLPAKMDAKVHLRMNLPASVDELWKRLDGKVRNQVRKGERNELKVAWGGVELLDDFYDVFSRNMRDLGTPVYGREFFAAILHRLADRAELCVVRNDERPLAGGLLLH
ncbi:MAG: GNAT family N-acetyltransferase, partial [Planctomycetia bacterium]